MTQQQREHQHDGDGGDEEEMISIFIRGVGDSRERFKKVRKGTRVKDLLGEAKHEFNTGLRYKLNNRLLRTDEETGELLENPEFQESATLVIQQAFQGGC